MPMGPPTPPMSQIDFVLIRMVADLTINAYTTTKFMRNKTFCPEQYKRMACCDEEGRELCPLGQAKSSDQTPLRNATAENDVEAGV